MSDNHYSEVCQFCKQVIRPCNCGKNCGKNVKNVTCSKCERTMMRVDNNMKSINKGVRT